MMNNNNISKVILKIKEDLIYKNTQIFDLDSDVAKRLGYTPIDNDNDKNIISIMCVHVPYITPSILRDKVMNIIEEYLDNDLIDIDVKLEFNYLKVYQDEKIMDNTWEHPPGAPFSLNFIF